MKAIGRAADPVVKPPRSDRDAAGDADARRKRPCVLEIDDRLRNEARMYLQISASRQRAQRRGRDLAEAGLDRGAVSDVAGDGPADGSRDGVVGPIFSPEQVLLALDIGGQRIEGNGAGAGGSRQTRIDVSDPDRNARPQLGDEIDNRAEAAVSVRIRRRHHEHGGVDRRRFQPLEDVAVTERQEPCRSASRLQFRRHEERLDPTGRVREPGRRVQVRAQTRR